MAQIATMHHHLSPLLGPVSPPPSSLLGSNSQQSELGSNNELENVSNLPPSLQGRTLNPTFLSCYRILYELGSGGFGFVCAIEPKPRAASPGLACKFILKAKALSGLAMDPILGWVPLEVYVLRNMAHENIVRFVDYYEDASFYYLITELHGTRWDASQTLPSGDATPLVNTLSTDTVSSSYSSQRTPMDLFECIERHHHLSEHQAKTIFRQIISAISYMHSRGVCHRDIKDENILIDSTLSVKLIDFGSAAFFDVPGGQKFDRFMGTIQYAAPEILRREKYRGPEAEVWALGCCLYIMLTGEVPFSTPDQALHSPFSSPSVKVSNTCHHLLSIMLEKRIGLRANIPEILAHPWLLNKAL